MNSRTTVLMPRHGNWVDGEAFFARDHELAQLHRHLERGAHVLLIGQRRTGKTGLMREFARRHGTDFDILFVDLEDGKSAEDAVIGITLAAREHVGVWTRVRGAWEAALGSVEELGGDMLAIKLRDGLAGDWRARGDRVFADLARSDRPVVLMLDELAFLVSRLLRDDQRRIRPDGPVRVEEFLSWLRKNALTHAGKLRLVLAGSIGIEPLARRAEVSGTLNHLTPMVVEPWDGATAIACLEALSAHEGITLDDDACAAVVESIGSCIPYHVQLVHQHLVEDAHRAGRTVVSERDVKRVYATRVLGMHGHMELAHMEERLRGILSPEEVPLALDLLTEAAVSGHLPPAAARILAEEHAGAAALPTLRAVMDLLEHDGYLRHDNDGWRFASRLLKDWWRRRFSEFYIPAAERVT